MNLRSANKAIFRGHLNNKLSKMTNQDSQEAFQALRALKEDSSRTDTMVYEKLNEGKGAVTSPCWDAGCTYPVCILPRITELDAEIMPLTNDLVIIEASGTELQILEQQSSSGG